MSVNPQKSSLAKNIGLAFLVFTLAIFTFFSLGFTQGSLKQAFWRASGHLLLDSQQQLNKPVPGFYFPERAGALLNKRGSEVLARVNEPIICGTKNSEFVCRLVNLSSTSIGPVNVYSVVIDPKHQAILRFSHLDCEPNVYARIQSKLKSETLRTHAYVLTANELVELNRLVDEAEGYYKSHISTGVELSLHPLEFQKNGEYYFYPLPEPSPLLADRFQALFDKYMNDH
ncbi:MAG: hypothetical protein KGS72_17360 [Cyanobacteria bacterium REEB67]|nr:hypothetical protein [Cyanobacteria bacterium REEB67]